MALIKKENPFPAVCGHVCNRRCEDACTRGTIDRAVAIDEVKKFIAHQDLIAEHRYVAPKVIPSNKGGFDEKIAIIGGGPGGFGGGDIKLMFGAGFFLGAKLTVVAAFIGILLGGGFGALLLAAKKADRKTRFAFGPFLCIGIAAAMFFGERLADWYIGLL